MSVGQAVIPNLPAPIFMTYDSKSANDKILPVLVDMFFLGGLGLVVVLIEISI